MKLTFLGAAHEVTGSCYYLEAGGKKILIDCGMEQGVDYFENEPLPVMPSAIDMVLLTHAHIDHSGKLPLLSKQGFAGQIFATEGTEQLCQIMLMDSAHIQESDAEWKNRKAERSGKPMVEPLYTVDDAQNALKCFVGIPYGEEKYIAEGIRIRFIDAGHLLGSASIEIWIREGDVEKKIIFSGDIGNTDQPLINDPTYPEEADYVVMESTYGQRVHERPTDYASALAGVLQKTFDRGGNVVIPSFAVGRTQEMLYFIRIIKEKHMVTGHDGFEVFVDSPLANEATEVFYKRMYSDLDEEASALLQKGINPISFPGLRTAVTSADSVAINTDTKSKVILSASGMCDAGRIRHHLKHNLWRPECTVLFVGYQSVGTLGRALVEGAESVKLFGEEIQVKAQILQLPGISGHADSEGLMRWISAMNKKPEFVFVTHGDASACEAFRDRLHNDLGLNAYAPYSGTQFDLAEGALVYEAPPRPLRDVDYEEDTAGDVQADGEGVKGVKTVRSSAGGIKAARLYRTLLQAGERLLSVIRTKSGAPNSDLKKMTRQIEEFCDKWED